MIDMDSNISFKDRWGAFCVRMGINRHGYKVEPGLYRLNNPDTSSPVFVTANYKLTFDILRGELKNIPCHLLILDTKGINVWCAAGKGSFGTDELIKRLDKTELENIINHKELILPQLGAPGMEAYKVEEKTGFKIKYGPVEARDIPAYLEMGKRKSDEMRYKQFPFKERAVLVPLELIQSWKLFFPVLILFFVFSGITQGWNSLSWQYGLPALMGVLSGAVLTPLLLPLIPFRSFAVKGLFMGIIISILWIFILKPHLAIIIAGIGVLLSLSSFLSMNFTGASTYTSLSGVKKEMAWAVPLQLLLAIVAPLVSLILFYMGVL